MHSRLLPCLLVISALSLSACAQDKNAFPSLAKRPAERVTATYGVPQSASTPEPLPLPSAAVLGEVDSLVAQAQQADARFRKGEAAARSQVGRAGRAAVGSEAWSVATTAVSELVAARGQAMVPLAELDRMFADAMTRGEDVTRIADARDKVIAIIGRQDDVIGALTRQLAN